jgi:hypothetical protein
MKKLLASAAISIGVLAATAAPAFAGGVPNHNHFLTTPGSGGVVQVGPPVCENPEVLHRAFHNFHDNVHTGAPAAVGDLAVSRVLC